MRALMKMTMKNKLRRAVLLVLTLALAAGLFGACSEVPQPTAPSAEEQTYTVTLKTASGQALSKVEVFVYADETLDDLVTIGKTDTDGVASFTLSKAQEYTVVLKNVPGGYPTEVSYPITQQNTEIVLTAKLIANPDMSKQKFRLHDVMFDFSVTDTEGKIYTLSELLQQKKAVVLNFWFVQCNPCKAEFPFLQEAYDQYRDDIALLALNPFDSTAAIAQYRTAQGLTVPMASVDEGWVSALELLYYPTTIVIDCYGNINLMHVGSVDNVELFENMFAYYAAEDYVQKNDVTSKDFAVE